MHSKDSQMTKKRLTDQLSTDLTGDLAGASGVDDAVNASVERDMQNNTTDVVAFSLSDRLFGVEITSVQEVVKFGDITRVPLAAKYVKGVMNLRGNITPVIDLYTRFSLPASGIGMKTRIIVMNIKDQAVGFLVDQVSRIIPVAESDMEDVSNFGDQANNDYINGVVKIKASGHDEHQSELLLMLDLAGVFNDSVMP